MAGPIQAEVPREFGKSLRACVCCRLVKTFDQFLASGCENCGFFGMDGQRDRVADCTTPNFQSLLTVMDPASSWAAKWQHLNKKAAGAYALSIQGEPPQYVEDLMEDNGIALQRQR